MIQHPKLRWCILIFAFFILIQTRVIAQPGKLPGFTKSQFFDEQLITFKYPNDVTIHINAPSADSLRVDRMTSIVLFALPNGNTIDWTIGKEAGPNEDWHFEIQHIGAQTRFLRNLVHDRNIVTVYLEAEGLSWPTWSGNHAADKYTLIYALVDSIRKIFAGFPNEVVLNGHSGGGNFIFNFINGKDAIPDYIKRIAFLDSDYNYSNDLNHGVKLASWLNASPEHFLCVLAYNDSIALYMGEPIVSPTGGTWYRSKMMQRKLAEYFSFAFEDNEEFLKWFAMDGRIQFWLKKNPTRAILHTVQVERNGFIHSMTSGTSNDQNGYQYYGAHAYDQYVQKLPPEDIGSLMLNNDPDGKLRLTFQPVEHGETYRIFWSLDGRNFQNWIDVRDSTVALSSLTSNSLYFFRVQGISPWGQSQPSEVLAGVPGSASSEVLIINGFDAVKTENTRDFIRQHAAALFANGLRPVSASNDAMVAGMTNLSDYQMIDFIVGTDLYLTETVSPEEQALLKSYLQNGGNLFISGIDIAYDLDSRGKSDDKDFCANYLKTKYFARSPLNQTGTYYQVEFLAGWSAAMSPFFFDNGSQGTYNVSRPNTMKPINRGEACLIFSTVDSSDGVAGVCFSGMFPFGTQPGKVLVTSIPFETIYPDNSRALFMKTILDFFEVMSDVKSPGGAPVQHFDLAPNYPNPFNAETRIAFSLPARSKVRLTVYNSLGQQVSQLVDGFFDAGWHNIDWQGSSLPSGIYLYRLEAAGYSQVKKMALIR